MRRFVVYASGGNKQSILDVLQEDYNIDTDATESVASLARAMRDELDSKVARKFTSKYKDDDQELTAEEFISWLDKQMKPFEPDIYERAEWMHSFLRYTAYT